MIEIPNGVLFKIDNGTPCIILRRNDEWYWDLVIQLKKDYWPDISPANPFEFVFVIWKDKVSCRTINSKSIIPNQSFLKLHESGKFKEIVAADYDYRFGQAAH